MSDRIVGDAPRGWGEHKHPAPARQQISQAALWFGLVGGAAAWSLQTLVNLPTASHGCFPQLYPLARSSYSVAGIAFTVSVISVLICIAAAAVAWRSWRRTREEHQQASGQASGHTARSSALETGEGRTRFMALAGVLASNTFLLVALVHLSAVFLVSACGV